MPRSAPDVSVIIVLFWVCGTAQASTCRVRIGGKCVMTCLGQNTNPLYWYFERDEDSTEVMSRVALQNGDLKIEEFDPRGWQTTGGLTEQGLYTSLSKDGVTSEDEGSYLCKSGGGTLYRFNVTIVTAPVRATAAKPNGDPANSGASTDRVSAVTGAGIGVLLLLVILLLLFLGYKLRWWESLRESTQRWRSRWDRGPVSTGPGR